MSDICCRGQFGTDFTHNASVIYIEIKFHLGFFFFFFNLFKIAFLSAPFWGAFWQSLFLIHHSSLPKMLYCFRCYPSIEIGGGRLELIVGVHSLVREICYKTILKVKGQDKLSSLCSVLGGAVLEGH